MLQIEEWFRRSLMKKGRRPASTAKPAAGMVHNRSQETAAEIGEVSKTNGSKEAEPEEREWIEMFESENEQETENISESEQIEQDVTDMVDMKKEDFLLQQIDEFREKAKQLQMLMKNRETKAEELQGVVNEREAKASELDNLIQVRKGEADKIMENVSGRIDEMSAGVRNEMSGLSDTLSREVSGLSQNLTQELGGVSQEVSGLSQNLSQGLSGVSQNLSQGLSGVSQNLSQGLSGLSQNLMQELGQSTEKTRQAVEAVAQNMIDQNTRSLEGLKEQLGQINQREKINELSTEMSSQITALKSDLADKIHAEDVKCYRNIQVSLDDQSKLLSEGDEKTRQYIQEQMDSLNRQVKNQSKILKTSLFFTVINFLGIVGILAFLSLI